MNTVNKHWRVNLILPFKLFLLATLVLLTQALGAQSPQARVDSIYQHGWQLFKKQEYAPSADSLLLAKRFFENTRMTDSVLLGNILHYTGTNYQALGRFLEAKLFLLDALTLRQRILKPCDVECGKTLNNLSLTCMGLGELREGYYYAVEALKIKECGPNGRETKEYANSQNTLGQVLIKQGDYDRADSVYTDQLALRRRVFKGDMNDPVANSLSALAALRTVQFRYEEADSFQLIALGIMKYNHGDSSRPYLSVLMNVGLLKAKMGLHEHAESKQRKTVSIALNLWGPTTPEYALALYNLGFILQQQGRFKEAEPYLWDGYRITSAMNGEDHPEALKILGNIAAGYYYTDAYEKAPPLLKKIAESTEKSDYRGEEYYEAALNYGVALTQQKQYEAAELWLFKAKSTAEKLKLAVNQTSPMRYSLGMLYLNWGRYGEAEKYLKQALEIVAARPRLVSPNDIALYFNLSRLYREKNDWGNAVFYIREGREQLKKYVADAASYLSPQELQQVSEFAFAQSDEIQLLFQKWNNPESAALLYDHILYNKGFLLDLAEKKRRQFENNARQDPAKWKTLLALRRMLAEQISKIIPDEQKINELFTRVNALEKDQSKGLVFEKETTWQQVRDALGPKDAAIEFVRFDQTVSGETRYYALILRKNLPAPLAVPLCTDRELTPLFDTKGRMLPANYGADGELRLYKLLVEPLMPYLKDTRKIWFAPDGLLHRINIPAIGISAESILVDRFDLVLVGSTRQISTAQPIPSDHPRTARIMSGINFGTSDKFCIPWNNLEFAATEGRSIKQTMIAYDCQIDLLEDTMANERALRRWLSGSLAPEVIHLATHAGYFKDSVDFSERRQGTFPGQQLPLWAQNPMLRTGIVLAGANCNDIRKNRSGDDGIMTAYELSLLNLRGNKLFVVSACESGLGDIDDYEGVWGIQRACRIAGGSNVMLSLWESDDSFSGEFMRSFYDNWLSSGKDVHSAFYATINSMRAFDRDPGYWAGFILSE